MTAAATSISPLLTRLASSKAATDPSFVTADEVALSISYIFTGQLSDTEMTELLERLHTTGLDHRPDVIAKCAAEMRMGGLPVGVKGLREVVRERGVRIGAYGGGLCDIVGTGGDGHNTFNISTAASILASSLLLIAKHGNRASTSRSGSADLLQNLRIPLHHSSSPDSTTVTPDLSAATPANLPTIYATTNYAFLFAPLYHSGLRHAAAVRKSLPHPTIFNLLGPLANPADSLLEARVVGVKAARLGPAFAEALRLSGVHKALVVCGAEELDEISCAGPTRCWWLKDEYHPSWEEFSLRPADFGLLAHPLRDVAPGGSPAANATTLLRLLAADGGGMPESAAVDGGGAATPDDETMGAIFDFVLMNTAALLVVSGACDDDGPGGVRRPLDPAVAAVVGRDEDRLGEVGPGGGRWKEGVRLARRAVESGRAMEMLMRFAEVTASLRREG